MSGGSLGIRIGSYGSLPQQGQNGKLYSQTSFISRKPSKMLLANSREKDRFLPVICRYLGRKRVAMLIMFVFAFVAFISGFVRVNKADTSLENTDFSNSLDDTDQTDATESSSTKMSENIPSQKSYAESGFSISGQKNISSTVNTAPSGQNIVYNPPHTNFPVINLGHEPPLPHPCDNFAFPPPPSANRRRMGPRPCPVCYVPVDKAIARMPAPGTLSRSPLLKKLNYVHEKIPYKNEPHGGSDFGGYPSLKQRNDSFEIKESMTVHCGFVKGTKPGQQSGFDIDEADLAELEKSHDVIVASAIFGNYDIIQQPQNIGEVASRRVPFYMFIDEETEISMMNSSVLNSDMRVGIWRIIVVRNIPYTDSRRNGKVPKLLLHRIFPNVRYSIWIDGKLKLMVDPYQLLERFLWRTNSSFAISRHYRRFDVFEEAEANKAAGKYENSSIDHQIDFYKTEGLTPYSRAKLPITSDVPEGCVIIKEHIPITNLFTCLWFNEVDRFTARDQLSFSTVRDKIMSKVDWSINMFMDCERRNFVIQTYHRDLLEHMPPPTPIVFRAPVLPNANSNNKPDKTHQKKNLSKRGRVEKRSGSKRHRKIAGGNREGNSNQ